MYATHPPESRKSGWFEQLRIFRLLEWNKAGDRCVLVLRVTVAVAVDVAFESGKQSGEGIGGKLFLGVSSRRGGRD